jgi:hypothetical protein
MAFQSSALRFDQLSDRQAGPAAETGPLTAVIPTAVPPFAIALLLGPLRKAERRQEAERPDLEVAGWHPRQLKLGAKYTIADLHPTPAFGLCNGGH